MASPLDAALPLSAGALTDPARFARLLRAGACGEHALSGRPTTIVATAHESPSSNCRNTIFEIEWDGASPGPGAPESLFVKQPSADFATRVFANVIGFWEIECTFCRNLADSVPIAMPRIHAVVQRRSRFLLVMENLLERPDTRLFVNRDLLEGVGPTRARACLRTLARLHAGFADWTGEARERGLPSRLHPFLSPSLAPVMLSVNRLAVGRCHARVPQLFDGEAAALYRRALDHWPTLLAAWYREPLTLLHGDSHLGNFFETGDEMGMIDFQGAHWGPGIRDVQYFLVNSMRAEQLALQERTLVEAYCEELTRLGKPLSPDAAFEQYRGFSFQTLMTAVVSRGLGSFTDSDAVMQVMLERAVAATRRLGFESWLDARLAKSPVGSRPGSSARASDIGARRSQPDHEPRREPRSEE